MGKRVLLADDSVTIQRAFAMVFGGQDLSITAARSLDEALTAARQNRPDLIVADVALGNKTGYELCSAVKADGALKDVPVYILASNHNPFDESKGRQCGAEGQFSKPFESQSLIDGITQALAKVGGASGGVAAQPAAAVSAFVPPPAEKAAAPAQKAPAASATAAARRSAPTTEIEIEGEVDVDDDYGEFTIERTGASAASPLPAAPAPPPAPGSGSSLPAAGRMTPPGARPAVGAPFSTPASASGGAGLRPSLIPGARPQTAPVPTRPPAPTATPPAATARPVSPATPPPGSASRVGGRTIMGLPAMVPPSVGGPGAAGAKPATPPAWPSSSPSSSPRPSPPASSPPPALSPPPLSSSSVPASTSSPMREAVSAKLDQKLASLSAKGPEYEAIAKLSREIIEQVVWEVVPELAEVIIRQEVDRLGLASGKRP